MVLMIEKGPTGRIKRLRQVLADMTAEDVLSVLSEFSLEAASLYGFAESTDFDLVHYGLRYPPKAILGLAAAQVIGRPLRSDEFTGGEYSACFAILKSLGFSIERKVSVAPVMLVQRGLQRFRLYEREEISQLFEPGVIFHSGAGRWGISGIIETPKESGNFVLIVTLGEPVEGNPYQDALTADGYLIWESQTRQNLETAAIKKMIVHDADKNTIHLFLRPADGGKYAYLGLLDYFSHDPNKINPVHFVWKVQGWDPGLEDIKRLQIPLAKPLIPAYSSKVSPPLPQALTPVAAPVITLDNGKKTVQTKGGKNGSVDWAARDLRNRELGLRGEKLVLIHEVQKLRRAGRDDLASQVVHVAEYDSTAGYDICSFMPNGRQIRIEVKTTQGPASTPFYISMNEVLASREDADSYVIYRVFDLREGGEAKFFELRGDAELSCDLTPTVFRAYPGSANLP